MGRPGKALNPAHGKMGPRQKGPPSRARDKKSISKNIGGQERGFVKRSPNVGGWERKKTF